MIKSNHTLCQQSCGQCYKHFVPANGDPSILPPQFCNLSSTTWDCAKAKFHCDVMVNGTNEWIHRAMQGRPLHTSVLRSVGAPILFRQGNRHPFSSPGQRSAPHHEECLCHRCRVRQSCRLDQDVVESGHRHISSLHIIVYIARINHMYTCSHSSMVRMRTYHTSISYL